MISYTNHWQNIIFNLPSFLQEEQEKQAKFMQERDKKKTSVLGSGLFGRRWVYMYKDISIG